MPASIKAYDASYRKLFANREVMLSLLEGFLPEDILEDMDLSSLEALPTDHITPDNRERRNDLVWRARYGSSTCYLVIMLEFQSTVDRWMAVRIHTYTGLLFEDIIRRENPGRKGQLPLILPFVIYNGKNAWTAPEDINYLQPVRSVALDPFQPHQKYFLLDIKRLAHKMSESGEANLSGIIFDLENAASIDAIVKAIGKLAKILPENDKLQIHEAFLNLLATSIMDDPEAGSQIGHCRTVQEAYAMLTEDMPLWKVNLLQEGFTIGKEEGFAKGKEEGISIGKKEGISIGGRSAAGDILKEILESRFGQEARGLFREIDEISSTEILKKLALEAVGAETLKDFAGMLEKAAKWEA